VVFPPEDGWLTGGVAKVVARMVYAFCVGGKVSSGRKKMRLVLMLPPVVSLGSGPFSRCFFCSRKCSCLSTPEEDQALT